MISLFKVSTIRASNNILNIPRLALRAVGGGVAACNESSTLIIILALPRLGVAMGVSTSVVTSSSSSSSSVTSPLSSFLCLISAWNSSLGLMDERVNGRRASGPAWRSSRRSSAEVSSSSSVGASDGCSSWNLRNTFFPRLCCVSANHDIINFGTYKI